MKSLHLNQKAFMLLLDEYESWLSILGYAASSVYYLSSHVQEYLNWMESKGKIQIRQITAVSVDDYVTYLESRINQRRGGGLSNEYLHKHIQALQLLFSFLRQSMSISLPKIHANIPYDTGDADVLTKEEVRSLYKAAEYLSIVKKNHTQDWIPEALHLRDRAMLGLYYGCGLRRNEGVQMDVSDLNWSVKTINVRKGKNYQARVIPIPAPVLLDLENYCYEGRGYFLQKNNTPAFLASMRGARIDGQTLLLRLKKLIEYSNQTQMQQKKVGLHTLRHSIATHLLQNGMPIESIAQYLGHKSLATTQRYTHLEEELN